jgi:membrane-bound inhibitor of C-type lysozyme
MPILIKNTLLACSLAMAAAALCAAPSANAAEPKNPVKAKAKAAAKSKTHPKAVDVVGSEPEPDISDTTTTEFDCELGNKITTYHNDKDDGHIALRWKKRLHRLTRVGTTTGAKRFENPTFGLVWIGIPAKGMLLDSRLNRQLANECKNAEQMKPVVEKPAMPATAPATGDLAVPAAPPAAAPAAPDAPAAK